MDTESIKKELANIEGSTFDIQLAVSRISKLLNSDMPIVVRPLPGPVEKPVAVPVFIPPTTLVVFDCTPPNGDYLAAVLLTELEKAARDSRCIITIIHAGSPSGWDLNHAPGDIDIRYQLNSDGSLDAKKTARMLLSIIAHFPKIQRSTLPNPTDRQKLSAALSGMDTGNHGPVDNPQAHAHVPLLGGQIIVGEAIREAILEAV
jgi:hypothetical protein